MLDARGLCTPALQARLGARRQERETRNERKQAARAGGALASEAGAASAGGAPGDDGDDDETGGGADYGMGGVPRRCYGMYELWAVVAHKGRSTDAGHYMAFLKDDAGGGATAEPDRWLAFDDSAVSTVHYETHIRELEGVPGCRGQIGYIAFYRRTAKPAGWSSAALLSAEAALVRGPRGAGGFRGGAAGGGGVRKRVRKVRKVKK